MEKYEKKSRYSKNTDTRGRASYGRDSKRGDFSKKSDFQKKSDKLYKKEVRREKKEEFVPDYSNDVIAEELEQNKLNMQQHGTDESAVVEGRNAVFELLRSQRGIEKIYIAKDMNRDILEKARSMRVQVSEIDKRKLEAMAESQNAQGVIALCSPIEYASVDDMIELARSKEEDPFIIIADGLNSPHNLGAIIRTAECAGAHGVIIPVHRSIGITPTVTRVSEGAVNHILIAKETNIHGVIEELKEKGVWTACADMDGSEYTKCNLNMPIALVIGGEDKGITPMIKKSCDMTLSIPQKGQLNSLNASVAAAILMYEVVRQRG